MKWYMWSFFIIWKIISSINTSYDNEDDDYDNDHNDYKLPEFSEITFSISGTLAFHASKRTKNNSK